MSIKLIKKIKNIFKIKKKATPKKKVMPSEKKVISNNIADFEIDSPITLPEEDIFGYNKFAMKFAELLHNRISSEGFVTAINAPWGYGKTSCINLIKHKLKSYNDVEIINFNPWFIPIKQNTLITQFFMALKPYIQKLFALKSWSKKEKEGFFRVLSGFSISCGIIEYNCKDLSDAFLQPQTIYDEKKEIEDFLNTKKEKIIVFIDDIDRLSKEEIIQIFRLIKSVANFKNITYVLSFDLDVVSTILETEQLINGRKYLEKIIQLQLNLPQPSNNAIENYLLKKLKLISSDANLSETDKQVWGAIYSKLIQSNLLSIRDVNRLYNAILTTYTMIKDDVNFIDFVVIEYLRLFHNNIWKIIKYNQYLFSSNFLHKAQNKDELKNLIDELPQEEQKIAQVIITILFPNIEQYIPHSGIYKVINISNPQQLLQLCEKEKRICSPYRINYYFTMNVGEDSISDVEIQHILNNIATAEDLTNIFQKYYQIKLSTGKTMLLFLLEKLRFYADEIKQKKLTEIFYKSIFASALRYNNEDDILFDIFTPTISTKFEYLLIALYLKNSPKENFQLLSKVIENPEHIVFSCQELSIIGQNFGYFTSSSRKDETYLKKQNYLDLVEKLIEIIEINFRNIKKMADKREVIRFIKEFDKLKANNLLYETTYSDKDFLNFLKTLYKVCYTSINNGTSKKEKHIYDTDISYWFDFEKTKTRLISITTNNQDLSKAALEILSNIKIDDFNEKASI